MLTVYVITVTYAHTASYPYKTFSSYNMFLGGHLNLGVIYSAVCHGFTMPLVNHTCTPTHLPRCPKLDCGKSLGKSHDLKICSFFFLSLPLLILPLMSHKFVHRPPGNCTLHVVYGNIWLIHVFGQTSELFCAKTLHLKKDHVMLISHFLF